MGIGASILLIAIGAILTFALNVRVGFLDLDVVGWVLMLAGVVGLVLTTLIWGPRRRAVVTRETADPAVATEYRRVEERSDIAPPRDRL